ncbi:MAG TPA: HPr family phosphocarrier protein [Pyrinomonadaceae bacterium]|nr:HPr family phosphocarrier protein [Pyrinomonadaceae bacterium]
MREGSVKVVNQLGLHARAAAQVVRVASNFKSRISLLNSARNAEADARSILNMLTLSASAGTALFLKVEGEDENEAYEAILALFASGLGEL